MTIYASDLSTTDARRSPVVSREVFGEIEQRGRARLAYLRGLAHQSTDGLARADLPAMLASVTAEPWGGVTVSAGNGTVVAPVDDPDAYAVTVRLNGKSSMSVPIGSDADRFARALRIARGYFADELAIPGACLGVFHDADRGRVDLDPVLIVRGLTAAHEVGAACESTGGAYRFADGLGYWPPHVAE